MKSSGFDDISARLCKDAFLVLSTQLTYMFNCSLRDGIFPDAWKAAKVIPIYKSGDREYVGNYRPVSLQLLPGKLLETIVHIVYQPFSKSITFCPETKDVFVKGSQLSPL